MEVKQTLKNCRDKLRKAGASTVIPETVTDKRDILNRVRDAQVQLSHAQKRLDRLAYYIQLDIDKSA